MGNASAVRQFYSHRRRRRIRRIYYAMIVELDAMVGAYCHIIAVLYPGLISDIIRD